MTTEEMLTVEAIADDFRVNACRANQRRGRSVNRPAAKQQGGISGRPRSSAGRYRQGHAAMTDAEPIPLADACQLYPGARLTVSTLRAEAARPLKP